MAPLTIICLVLLAAGKVAAAVYLYRQAQAEQAEPLRWAALGLALDILGVVLWFCLRPSAAPPKSELQADEPDTSLDGPASPSA